MNAIVLDFVGSRDGNAEGEGEGEGENGMNVMFELEYCEDWIGLVHQKKMKRIEKEDSDSH